MFGRIFNRIFGIKKKTLLAEAQPAKLMPVVKPPVKANTVIMTNEEYKKFEIPKIDNIVVKSVYDYGVMTFSPMASNKKELVYNMQGCKEYILDAAYSTIFNKGLYKPLYMEEIIIVCHSSLDHDFSKSLKFLHLLENAFKFEYSKWSGVKGSSAIVFYGDKKWFLSPPLTSLYTLAIRSAYYYKIEDTLEETFNSIKKGCPSGGYLINNCIETIRWMADQGVENIFTKGQEEWDKGSNIHNSGINSFSYSMKSGGIISGKYYDDTESKKGVSSLQ